MVINITNDTFKKATLTADVSGLSVRKQLQYTAALINAGGGDINDVSLSKTTIQRNKQTARTEMLSKIQNEHQELWQNEDSFWALHWDGKTLKQTTHTESKKSVLAVVLKEIYTDFEILVDVMDMANGTGSEAEATKIMKALEKMKMQISKIVACSFDTTATNSGLNKGVVVQVQEALHHPVFQMACRHHILELVCGAICKNAFGSKTESPTEPLFKRFAEIWCSIDTSTYFSYVFKSRKLQRIKDDVLKFLWNWIQNGKTARGDYLELVELTIMFLGGSKLDSKAFTFKSPGAFHHARWMAKVIYTLKIALFQKQLAKIGFESLDVLDKITSLASFLALFYVKSWCNASLTTDAPVNDLELWNQFETIKKSDPRTIKSFPSLYSQFANSAQEKLERHLWTSSKKTSKLERHQS